MSKFSKEEILKSLDNDTTYNFFLDLEHGYFYTAGNRINLFSDDKRWAIVFEKSGYGNRSGRAEIELNYFGNCLTNLDMAGLNGMYTCNAKYLTLIDGDEFERIQVDFELVSPKMKTIIVRNRQVAIEHDIKKYKAKGIEIQDFDNPKSLIDFQSLVRYLDEEYPDLFRATISELRICTPDDLPFLMKIDK